MHTKTMSEEGLFQRCKTGFKRVSNVTHEPGRGPTLRTDAEDRRQTDR